MRILRLTVELTDEEVNALVRIRQMGRDPEEPEQSHEEELSAIVQSALTGMAQMAMANKPAVLHGVAQEARERLGLLPGGPGTELPSDDHP